jgi:hypothetical protein
MLIFTEEVTLNTGIRRYVIGRIYDDRYVYHWITVRGGVRVNKSYRGISTEVGRCPPI